MPEKIFANNTDVVRTVDNMYEALAVSRQFVTRLEAAGMLEEVGMLKQQVTSCFRTLGAVANTSEMIKYEEGQTTPFVFDASAYLTDLVNNCQSKIRFYGPKIRIDADPKAFVKCNPDRFAACILNLIVNSLQNVDLDEGDVHVTVKIRNQVVAITVSDNGYGLPEDVEPNDYCDSQEPRGFSVLYKFCKSIDTVPVIENGDYTGVSVTVKFPLQSQNDVSNEDIHPDLGTCSAINAYLAKISEIKIFDIY